MPKGALLNYTTTVDVSKSIGEVMGLLQAHGARRIETLYENALCVGIAFSITSGEQELSFRLPVNIDTVHETLKLHYQQGKVQPRFVNREQAARIGWRILKDWAEAQIALIETGMVKAEEVFLPYLLDSSDRTLFQVMQDRWKMLPAPKEES